MAVAVRPSLQELARLWGRTEPRRSQHSRWRVQSYKGRGDRLGASQRALKAVPLFLFVFFCVLPGHREKQSFGDAPASGATERGEEDQSIAKKMQETRLSEDKLHVSGEALPRQLALNMGHPWIYDDEVSNIGDLNGIDAGTLVPTSGSEAMQFSLNLSLWLVWSSSKVDIIDSDGATELGVGVLNRRGGFGFQA